MHFRRYVAAQRRVSASTPNQAFCALLFLYREVLKVGLGPISALRPRRPWPLPVVPSRPEAARLLVVIDGLPTEEPHPLMCRLTYGAGLRLMEYGRLRVKDIDSDRG